VSNTCPGINSSGPLEVVGVTKPSPSILISSGLIPLAVEYAKSPPVIIVSYALGSGTKEPSDVFLRITSTSLL